MNVDQKRAARAKVRIIAEQICCVLHSHSIIFVSLFSDLRLLILIFFKTLQRWLNARIAERYGVDAKFVTDIYNDLKGMTVWKPLFRCAPCTEIRPFLGPGSFHAHRRYADAQMVYFCSTLLMHALKSQRQNIIEDQASERHVWRM